jgi:hypothetical protein
MGGLKALDFEELLVSAPGQSGLGNEQQEQPQLHSPIVPGRISGTLLR